MTAAALSLWDYERSGRPYNENKLGGYVWLLIGALLACAYGLPAVGLGAACACFGCGFTGVYSAGRIAARKIFSFKYYREVNQQLLAQLFNQMDTSSTQIAMAASRKAISADTGITSKRRRL